MKKIAPIIVILTITLIASIMPAAAATQTDIPEPIYLALGDSISTGYTDGGDHFDKEAFASIIAAEKGYTLYNAAVDGNTAAGIYGEIKNGALDDQIQGASLITITVGGNDMLAGLYQMTAETYNKTAASKLTTEEIMAILANPNDTRKMAILQSALAAMKAYPGSPLFEQTLTDFNDDFGAVITYIRSKNPTAKLIVETQYNPYKWLGSVYGINLAELMESSIQKLNQVIESPENGAGTDYIAADVYKAFMDSEPNLCNPSLSPFNLDFHPNAEGHAVIAKTFLKADAAFDMSKITVTITKAKTVKTAKAKSGKAVRVSWISEDTITPDGYQVWRSAKATGKFKRAINTEKTTYLNTSGLKTGTKYYYKVRGYKTVDGEKVYTGWSKVKSVTYK